MKRYSTFTIRSLLIFIGLLVALSGCHEQRQPINSGHITSIKVVMDDNYPPYAFRSEDGTLQGIAIDQWMLWEQKTGVQVEITGLPWGDALSNMKAGKFDVIDTIFFTEERAKVIDYTEPYAQINVLIFYLEDYGDRLDEDGQALFKRVRLQSQRMGEIIDALLSLSRVTRVEMRREPIDLSAIVRNSLEELRQENLQRQVE